MIENLYEEIAKRVRIERLRERTLAIHALEGNCSYSNFKASTDYAKKCMEESGFVQVEKRALKSDGKNTYFDCIMPNAWDMKGRAYVRILDDSLSEKEQYIADSDVDPFNSGVWGCGTPEGGLFSEILDDRNIAKEDPEGKTIAGKVILMDGYSIARYKYLVLHKAGAVIISDSKCADDYPQYCRWSNAIAFTGWYHTAEDPRIPVFNISPEKAAFLRKRLALGKVKCQAYSDAKISDGEIYTVSGLIPGKEEGEITFFAHMYEPFIPDDAAGGMIIMELCQAVKEASEAGVIPPLQKSLRIVLSMERYGYYEYFTDKERVKKILTVMSFDSACHFSGKGQPRLKLRESSILAPSFTDVIVEDLFRRYMKEDYITTERNTLSDDTFCSDGDMRIPSMWVHSSNPRCHHNAGPGFMDADWDLAEKVAQIMGTFVGLLAVTTKEEARTLADRIRTEIVKNLEEKITGTLYKIRTGAILLPAGVEKIRFHAALAARQYLSFNRYFPGLVGEREAEIFTDLGEVAARALPLPEGEIPLHGLEKEAQKLVVKRLVPGTLMSLAKVPAGERRSSSVIPDLLYMLFDGKRSLLEAMHLYEFEMEKSFSDADIARFTDYLEFLEKYGYVSLTKKN
ncbi:MAG: hypothetical protein J6A21_02155 [Lentisphaeria bacterium]|nr:hypothetical protein [Lentisphaeria bacterium]